jgi:hypothetical protein
VWVRGIRYHAGDGGAERGDHRGHIRISVCAQCGHQIRTVRRYPQPLFRRQPVRWHHRQAFTIHRQRKAGVPNLLRVPLARALEVLDV